MNDTEKVKILKAIANKNRFLILRLLCKNKELSVGDLAEITNSAFRSVSKDLRVLRKVNLVQFRNSFSKRLYSINKINLPKGILFFFKS